MPGKQYEDKVYWELGLASLWIRYPTLKVKLQILQHLWQRFRRPILWKTTAKHGFRFANWYVNDAVDPRRAETQVAAEMPEQSLPDEQQEGVRDHAEVGHRQYQSAGTACTWEATTYGRFKFYNRRLPKVWQLCLSWEGHRGHFTDPAGDDRHSNEFSSLLPEEVRGWVEAYAGGIPNWWSFCSYAVSTEKTLSKD